MSNPTRFGSPSAELALRSLLKPMRDRLWMGIGLAAAMHLSLTQVVIGPEQERVAKPLTTHFVKRQPRLTKPLELRKRPQPKRRVLKRRMVTLGARARRQGLRRGIQALEVLGSLARPRTSVSASVVWPGAGVEPEVLAEGVWGTRDPRESADMSLELMDIDAMDTGRYHAIVIQDPSDKRRLTGFIHVAMAEPVSTNYDPKAWRWRRGIQRLVDFVNQHTAIRADVSQSIHFDSEELFHTPWVYLCRRYRFDVTHSELANLGRYMLAGGFFWGDSFGTIPIYLGGYKSMNSAIIHSLETQGVVYDKDWNFERLPHSHPILHCYYDFDKAPMGWGASSKHPHPNEPWERSPHLDAVVINDVAICLRTKQAYAHAWADWGAGAVDRWAVYPLDPTSCFQFGVNTMVYALTREGSITHRVMDAVR